MVNISVDNQKIEVEENALLIKVLQDNDVEISHFCYHEALGVDGNCRMCMVEIEGAKRPQIACNTLCKEGLKVHTKSPNILKVKQEILELELINHPVDCPVCDQAGECSLQNYYMDFGLYGSRHSVEKTKKAKHVDLGSNVMLDQERCVLCARCTRFTQNISKSNELFIIGRGDQARVSSAPNKPLNNPYAMNVIDLCPVGALTSKDFRFQQRVWFLDSVESICHGCSKGCNITIDHNTTKFDNDRIHRYRPRRNMAINSYFMCDEGRLSFHKENKKSRHFPFNASTLRTLMCTDESKKVMLANASLSVENLSILKLFCDKYSIELFSLPIVDETFGDDWLRNSVRSANASALEFLEISSSYEAFLKAAQTSKLLININHPLLFENIESHAKIMHFTTHDFEDMGDMRNIVSFASYSHENGTLINSDNIIQKFSKSLHNIHSENTLHHIFTQIDNTLYKTQETLWSGYISKQLGLGFSDIQKMGTKLKGVNNA